MARPASTDYEMVIAMSSLGYRKHTPTTSVLLAALVLLLLVAASGRPVAAALGTGPVGQTAVSGKQPTAARSAGRRNQVKNSAQRVDAAYSGAIFLPVVANVPRRTPAQQVLDLINAERARVGCRPLSLSNRLTTAARSHSQDMAVNDYFDHTSPDGSTFVDRVEETGYDFMFLAENLAAGYPTPKSVFQGWMESPGHRANMLHCALEETGIGYYYLDNDSGSVNYHYYWTQVLATPID
jgi:uncharacterized protein YkwD